MPLRTVVKVGNISNLGDARYCAGMGVDLLGFNVIEGQPQYIDPALFQEIRGWISGPAIVAEIYGIGSAEQIAGIVKNYHPDYLELTDAEYQSYGHHIALPCIVAISGERSSPVTISPVHLGYLLVAEQSLAKFQGQNDLQPMLLQVHSAKRLNDILERYPVNGVALTATPEAGQREDYNELSDILGVLEES